MQTKIGILKTVILLVLFLGGNWDKAAAFSVNDQPILYLVEPSKEITHHQLLEDEIEPVFQGQFTSAGGKRTFVIEVLNSSYTTSDEFEFYVKSIWQLQLLDGQGVILQDTDGDGGVESGAVAPKTVFILNAIVSAPAVANVGEYNEAEITVYSDNLAAIVGKHILQNAIPAPFAQIYADYGLNNLYLNLVSPDKQSTLASGPLDIYGFNPILTGKDHFLMAWRRYHYANLAWNTDIEFSLFDHQGGMIVSQHKLTDNSQKILTINDFKPVADTGANGFTALFWYRSTYENLVSEPVENLWYAILNADGTVKFNPQTFTSNSIPANQRGGKSYRNTGVAALGNDRFVLTWVETDLSESGALDYVYYCVINENGDIIKPVSNLTGEAYDYQIPILNERPLAVTSLQNDRTIIVSADETNLFYVVLDRDGDILKYKTDSGFPMNNVDVVQLSKGNIIATMPVKEGNGWYNYFILESNGYEVIMNSGIGTPDNSYYNQYTLSVTRDNSNHAILTWVSSYSSITFEHLMYTLLDEMGNIVTPPTRFYQASAIDVYTPWIIYPLVASSNGYGNTSFSQPSSGKMVDLSIRSNPIILSRSAEIVHVPVTIKNQGLLRSTGIEIKAEMDKDLDYIGDTSGLIAKISGKTATWEIQDLDYLGGGSFEILLSTAPFQPGAKFPVKLTVSSNELDGLPEDNYFLLEIISADQTYFPFVSK